MLKFHMPKLIKALILVPISQYIERFFLLIVQGVHATHESSSGLFVIATNRCGAGWRYGTHERHYAHGCLSRRDVLGPGVCGVTGKWKHAQKSHRLSVLCLS